MSLPKSHLGVFSEIAVKSAFLQVEKWISGVKGEAATEYGADFERVLIEGFSKLKGSGTKIIQQLALEDQIQGKNYSLLIDSFKSETSMSFPLVEKVLRKNLTHKLNDFSSISSSSLASASLGQVHRAKLLIANENIDVVLKVQFPGVAKNINLEAQIIKKIVGEFKNPLLQATVTEILDTLIGELDFTNEMNMLNTFEKLSFRHCNIKTPKPFSKYSTSQVLTEEYMDGVALSDILRNGGMTSTAITQNIFLFVFESLFSHNCIYSDPHPGNFLDLDNGCLGVVDFGAIRKGLSSSEIRLLKKLFLDPKSNGDDFYDLYNQVGMQSEEISKTEFRSQCIDPYREVLKKILHQESCHFIEMRPHIVELRQQLLRQSGLKCMRSLSPRFTMVHKSIINMFFTLARLNARISTNLEMFH